MKRNVRTQWGNMLQVANNLGIEHDILEHTTLNEKWGVQSDVLPTSTPKVGWFCIGFGGHMGYIGTISGTYLSTAIDHYPNHASLYKPIPFIAREPGNDLSPQERENYGGRQLITSPLDNRQLIVYWLKKLSKSNLKVSSYKVTRNDDGTFTRAEYAPDSSALNPVQPNIDTNNVDQVVTSKTFYNAGTELDLSLTATDCNELINVAELMYGDAAYALISEYGIVSGHSTTVSGNNGLGGSIQYPEVLAAQINNFLSNRGSAADDSDNGVECIVDYGATEAMVADNGAFASYVQ